MIRFWLPNLELGRALGFCLSVSLAVHHRDEPEGTYDEDQLEKERQCVPGDPDRPEEDGKKRFHGCRVLFVDYCLSFRRKAGVQNR